MNRLLIAAAGLVLVLAGCAPTSSGISKTEERAVRSLLTSEGISPHVQAELIHKVETGQRWDSASGAKPVSTTTKDADGFSWTVYTFADGSVNRIGVEQPAGGGLAVEGANVYGGSITGCSRTGTFTYFYSGCLVLGSIATLQMSFRARYDVPNTKYLCPCRPGHISSVGTQGSSVFLGRYTQEYFGILRSTATATASASAEYRVKWSDALGEQTARLRIYVPFAGPARATIENGLHF